MENNNCKLNEHFFLNRRVKMHDFFCQNSLDFIVNILKTKNEEKNTKKKLAHNK